VTISDAYNFRRISDQLTTSGLVRAANVAAIGKEGYGLLINLLPADSEWALANEDELVTSQGVRYVHIPVDFDNPLAEEFDAFATALDDAPDGKVHAHCAANYRVSAFIGLYQLARGHWTVAEADEFMADLWNPAEHSVWEAFIATQRTRLAHKN
jgi:uncharacterized protein (TIGR01244 family)